MQVLPSTSITIEYLGFDHFLTSFRPVFEQVGSLMQVIPAILASNGSLPMDQVMGRKPLDGRNISF